MTCFYRFRYVYWHCLKLSLHFCTVQIMHNICCFRLVNWCAQKCHIIWLLLFIFLKPMSLKCSLFVPIFFFFYCLFCTVCSVYLNAFHFLNELIFYWDFSFSKKSPPIFFSLSCIVTSIVVKYGSWKFSNQLTYFII